MTRMVIITSWSGKTMQARKPHLCANCGGTIEKGTVYQRDVVRMGETKFVSPLRNIHLHLDCQTPWHHVQNVHQLPQLGRLALDDIAASTVAPIEISISSARTGTMIWILPSALTGKITSSPLSTQAASHTELHHALVTVLNALVTAAGDKRQAMRVSHTLNDMLDVIHNP